MDQQNNNWKIKCDLKISMKNEQDAQTFINSFSPEIKTIPMKRVSIEYFQEKNVIHFKINALDITAFRASLNSLLQFGYTVDSVIDLVDDE